MRPITIPAFVQEHIQPKSYFLDRIDSIKTRILQLRKGPPVITISIPAYNETDSILRTLHSLSFCNDPRSIEIIVVDNNSKDDTGELAKAAGATVLLETMQGVNHARTSGLKAAQGKYIVSADADTIYLPGYVTAMTKPLEDPAIAMTYGAFSFCSEGDTPRWVHFAYETLGDPYKWYLGKTKEEAMFVYGFTCAFRREQGLAVNAYEHPPGTNEDGYMGYKLRTRFGKLKRIHAGDGRAWTIDRRLHLQGGIMTSLLTKIKKGFTQKIDTSNLEPPK
jgi:cellulose synthase/poly-beta-1,6-N-acetylglucosamine synthase-like glycosyltransferase